MEDLLNAFFLMSNFVFVPAIAYGSQLALGAVGVTLVYGILRFSNFAHGDIMAFGTMIVILFTWLFQSYGINLGPLPTALIALPFGILATAIFLLGSDKFVYKFYREKKAVPVTYLIASVGIMFVLNGIVRFIIGPDDQRFADGERFIIKAKAMKQYLGTAEGVSIKVSQGLTVVTAVIVVVALFWFLNKTRTGKSMRAFSDNEDLAPAPEVTVIVVAPRAGWQHYLCCVANRIHTIEDSRRRVHTSLHFCAESFACIS